MIYPYKISSKEDLYKLSELASQEDYPIYISFEHGQVDAKSLLALFSIIGREVNIVAADHASSDEFSKFLRKLAK